MLSQRPIEVLASSARLAPYLAEARGDLRQATRLYVWAAEMGGALHSGVAFVEVAVRNAIDAQLREWNAERHGEAGREWALEDRADDALYNLLGRGKLRAARHRAEFEARSRPPEHPRHLAAVTHDDVVSQLMFGTWVHLIAPLGTDPATHQRLWEEALSQAFLGADASAESRIKVGKQLQRLRTLRNRVAHHDNLLSVNPQRRLNDMLAILGSIDPELPRLAMARNRVRRLAKEDPRIAWRAEGGTRSGGQ